MELSLFNATPGTTVAFNGLSLTDARGNEILVNGNFKDGMDRWGFSSDDHLVWRMKNLYLMLLFETGLLGLLSFSALCAGAILGGARAIGRGHAMGSAVIGAVVSFLISGMFDHLFEAPRSETVFLLVCMSGLISWERNDWPRDQDVPPLTATPGWRSRSSMGTPIGEIERY
jgi:hypothetical protein